MQWYHLSGKQTTRVDSYCQSGCERAGDRDRQREREGGGLKGK